MTPADQARLTELWRGSMTRKQIAAEMGVSDTTVKTWRARLGLPERTGYAPVNTGTWSIEDIATVKRMWATGRSTAAQVSDAIGHRHSRAAVLGKLFRMAETSGRGVAETMARMTQADFDNFRAEYKSGTPLRQMAKIFSIASSTVFRLAKLLNLPLRSQTTAMKRSHAERRRPAPPKPAVVIPRIPKEPAPPPDCNPVSLMAAKPWQCTWIIGEPKGPSSLYCGAPSVYRSWCTYHSQIGRGLGTNSERRAGEQVAA